MLYRFCGLFLFSSLALAANDVLLTTEQPGIYRIKAAQFQHYSTLFNRSKPVPIYRTEQGDVLFFAEKLGGIHKWSHPYQQQNVYRLSSAQAAVEPATSSFPDQNPLSRRMHLEENKLLIRLSKREIGDDPEPELWYWHKLTHVDKSAVEIRFDLPDLAEKGHVNATVMVRAISDPRNGGDLSDHQLDVDLNGKALTSLQWDGKAPTPLALSMPVDALQQTGNILALKVPKRTEGHQQNPIVDIVMLDYLETWYPASGVIQQQQDTVYVGQDKQNIVLRAESSIQAFDQDMQLLAVEELKSGEYSVSVNRAGRLQIVADNGYFEPVDSRQIPQQHPLVQSDQQADYLIIAHPRLMQSVAPLADMHRNNGMRVKLVNVHDIYDAFGHGIKHHQAIKDFLAHTYHHWQKPAPGHVLLVGDASWDVESDTIDDGNYANWTNRQLTVEGSFKAKQGDQYQPHDELAHRDLIPTWQYASPHGHSASDNWFVSVDGDDFLPDMAIGRFPVVDPEEVSAIVDKTIRYATEPEVGPWRRNMLWITNEQRGFQARSDRLATSADAMGFSSLKVYPKPEEKDNSAHQSLLTDAFNEGQLLVHFLGHGGRHIWRTGPPDYRKNHDLFTLDHVSKLEESNRLAVILSMTCFTAPFDHPSFDSIGEKFLREANKGAVAILGASWRNSPSTRFSEALYTHLTNPEETIGEAIRKAKHDAKYEVLVETYNLLGDPAIKMALPGGLELASDNQFSEISVTNDATFSGTALVEVLNAEGQITSSTQVSVQEGQLKIPQLDTEGAELVRVYVWNAERQLDGLLSHKLTAS